MNQKKFGMFAILALLAAGNASAQTIYRCTSQGHITLTDQPCDGTHPPAPAASGDATKRDVGSASSGIPADPSGNWRGSAQLLLDVSDKPVALAPATNALTLVIGADGKLEGALREQGCQLAGKLTSSYGRGQHAVVVKFSNCREQKLNLNYTGTLEMAPFGHPSRLAISGLGGFLGGPAPTSASLNATLTHDVSNISAAGH